MIETAIALVVMLVIALAAAQLFLWFKFRALERDPRQAELANHLVRLANDPYATPIQLQMFVALQGWSGRETANRIAHALGIPQQYMAADEWQHTKSVGQAIAREYRQGRMGN